MTIGPCKVSNTSKRSTRSMMLLIRAVTAFRPFAGSIVSVIRYSPVSAKNAITFSRL